MKKKNKSLKLILVYFVFFLLGDVLASNYFIKDNIENNCYKYLSNFHHLKKNCHAKEKWIKKSRSYNVYTDENGFRYNGKKKDNNEKKKILAFLGGSFTYGMGANFQKTYVGLIEESKPSFSIFNLGVPGYSPTVFNYQLKSLINKNIIPNKIFLVLDVVDVHNEAANWKKKEGQARPEKNKKVIQVEDKSENKLRNFKRNNLKVTRLFAMSINNFLRSIKIYVSSIKVEVKKPGSTDYGSFLYKDRADLKQSAWEPYGFDRALVKIKNNIEEISKNAKLIGSDFYIIIYPWPEHLEYGQSKFNWELFAKEVCEENSCTKLINFFPDFEEIKKLSDEWVTKIYIENDIHLTNFGQDIVAQKILKEAF